MSAFPLFVLLLACTACLATIEVTAVCTGHSILNNIDFDTMWAEFAAPGSINDPDMLQARDKPAPTAFFAETCGVVFDRRWATEG